MTTKNSFTDMVDIINLKHKLSVSMQCVESVTDVPFPDIF
jgi:hypothetical protein